MYDRMFESTYHSFLRMELYGECINDKWSF